MKLYNIKVKRGVELRNQYTGIKCLVLDVFKKKIIVVFHDKKSIIKEYGEGTELKQMLGTIDILKSNTRNSMYGWEVI